VSPPDFLDGLVVALQDFREALGLLLPKAYSSESIGRDTMALFGAEDLGLRLTKLVLQLVNTHLRKADDGLPSCNLGL
jgi:hypothetical protein